MLHVATTSDPRRFAVSPDLTWGQGFATYGGYVAAAAYRAALFAGHDRPLLSAQVVFLAPAPEAGFEVEIEPLRVGKGTSVIEARVWGQQDGVPLITTKILFSLGQPRPSQLDVCHRLSDAAVADLAQRRSRGADVPQVTGLIPEFLQNFQVRALINGEPFVGASVTDHVWAFRPKFDLEDLVPGEVALLLSDINLPPQLAMLSTPAPASTATWMMTLEQREARYSCDEWFYMLISLDAARQGYGSHGTALFDACGRLFTSNRQVTTAFDRPSEAAPLRQWVQRRMFQARYSLLRHAPKVRGLLYQRHL